MEGQIFWSVVLYKSNAIKTYYYYSVCAAVDERCQIVVDAYSNCIEVTPSGHTILGEGRSCLRLYKHVFCMYDHAF